MSIVDSDESLDELSQILEQDDPARLRTFLSHVSSDDLAIVARKSASGGAIRSLQLLLDMGVSPDTEWHGSLIRQAARNGHVEAVRLLLDRGADFKSDNPLLDAVMGGHVEVAQLLTEAGADVDAGHRGFPTPLAAAIEFKHPEIEAYLRAHGATALVGRGVGADKQVDAEPGSLREQLEELFGGTAYWSGKLNPDRPEDAGVPPLSFHVFQPTEASRHWTVVTDGMSARPMDGPLSDSGATRAELLLRLPPDWRIGHAVAQRDSEASWPIDSLRMVAEYPHRYGAVLRLGETVAFDEPPQPLHASTKLAGWVLVPGLSLEGPSTLTRPDGTQIELLSLVALHRAEIQLARSNGLPALMKALDWKNLSLVLDPKRASRAKKWLGLF
jgi:uncharacterized protein